MTSMNGDTVALTNITVSLSLLVSWGPAMNAETARLMLTHQTR